MTIKTAAAMAARRYLACRPAIIGDIAIIAALLAWWLA